MNVFQTNESLAVSVQQVHLSYGFSSCKVEVLKGVNFSVDKGTIFGLLGPSGCGKTTLLKCIIATLKPDAGLIKVFNKTPGLFESRIPGSGVGYMPQELALNFALTIREILAFFGRLHHMKAPQIRSRTEFLLQFLNLPNGKRLIKQLSGGEQRRVSFAVALLHQPPLLILDEPTVGVDPILRRSIWDYLVKLSTSGKVTIILTTHYIEEARQANKVALMRHGSILAADEPDLLIRQNNVSNLEDVFLKLSEEQSVKVIVTNGFGNYKPFDSKIEKEPDFCENSKDDKFIMAIVSSLTQLAIVLWAYSEFHDVNLAVFNQDINLGSKYLNYINNQTVHLIPVDSLQKGEDLVIRGEAWGVINIMPNFTSSLIKRYTSSNESSLQSSSLHVRYDNTGFQIAGTLQSALIEAFERLLFDSVQDERKLAQFMSTIQLDEPIYGERKASLIQFMFPGILVSIIFIMAMNQTAMTLASNKSSGLLQRYYASGATSSEIMFGHLFIQFGVMVVQVSLILLVAIEGFDLKNEGNFGLVFLLSVSLAISGMSFGFFLSAISNDPITAMILSGAFFFPLLMTSGGLWPIEGMPNALRSIATFLPLTAGVKAMNWIVLHGKGITWTFVWLGFASLWAWTALSLILTVLILIWKK